MAIAASVVAASSACSTEELPLAHMPAEVSVALRQDVDMVTSQTARLRDSSIVTLLVEAHGPRSGCFDCPLGARLSVRSGSEAVELTYSFSGNMPEALLAQARRKTAFGYVFVAVRISDDRLTLRVEPPG